MLVTYGSILPDFITHGMFASDAMIAQHPDTVRRFVHAWFDTIKYMRANKAETIKLTQPVTNLPPISPTRSTTSRRRHYRSTASSIRKRWR